MSLYCCQWLIAWIKPWLFTTLSMQTMEDIRRSIHVVIITTLSPPPRPRCTSPSGDQMGQKMIAMGKRHQRNRIAWPLVKQLLMTSVGRHLVYGEIWVDRVPTYILYHTNMVAPKPWQRWNRKLVRWPQNLHFCNSVTTSKPEMGSHGLQIYCFRKVSNKHWRLHGGRKCHYCVIIFVW